MAFLQQIPRKYFIPLVAAALLLLLALPAVFIDVPVSSYATSSTVDARNGTSPLGEFLQLLRIFGVADTVILLGLLLGLCGKRRTLLRILLSLLMVAAIVHPLKFAVGRERPNARNHRSFPSGDTATAFTLPQVFSSSPALCATASAVAVVVGASRIFYGEHYPSDVLSGAAVGLVAAIIGCWLAGFLLRRIRWMPSQQMILLATVVFLGIELLNAAFHGYHRHIIQFITWFGPAIVLYICHCRLRHLYGRNRQDTFLRKQPQLYYMVKNVLLCGAVLGGLMMVVPWFSGSPGLRAPVFSAGLLLAVFCSIERKQLRCGRSMAMIADSAALLYISIIYSAGYLTGIL